MKPRTPYQHVPETLALAEACRRRALTPWEAGFVDSLLRRPWPPSDRQRAILRRIAEGPPDYSAVRAAALGEIDRILAKWLPDGVTSGHEYEARNPLRGDRHPGSFRVNINTGKWSDFAAGIGGGDLVSLAAYLFGVPQPEAARRLARGLGLSGGSARHG